MEDFLNKWWAEICISIGTFFMPIWSLAAYCTLLIIADLITGIKAAKSRKEPITSRAMSKTITKFFLYNLAILVGHGASVTFYPEVELGKVVLAAITLVELTSIDENYKDIFGYSLFGKLLDLLKRDQNKLKKEENGEEQQG